MNKGKIEKLYDFDNEQVVLKKIIFFCHQFIHSYVFEVVFDDHYCLNGVFVNSDRERNKALYLIKIQKIIDIFEQIGNDYPTELQYTANFKTLDYDVKAWSHKIDSAG